MKQKIIGLVIFIILGQLMALVAWYFLEMNLFVPMAIGSVVGFLAGYKVKKNQQTN